MSLEAENIVVRFGRREAVRNANCSVTPGTLTALIGPNGSGKSTLVRGLAGALAPQAGTVRLDGDDLLRLRPAVRAAHMAFVPQSSPVGFDFTVRELVQLGANAARAGRADATAALARERLEDRVARALAALDLSHLAARSLLTLSGGEQQRAAIARAFAQDTPYLLLDEPTAHLDLRHQSAVLELLRRFAHDEGRGVLVVLHDLNLAAAADTLVLLDQGRVVARGTPSDVLTATRLGSVYQTNVHVLPHPVTGLPWVATGPQI